MFVDWTQRDRRKSNDALAGTIDPKNLKDDRLNIMI